MRNPVRRRSSLLLRGARHNRAQVGIRRTLSGAVFEDGAGAAVAAAMGVKDAKDVTAVLSSAPPGLRRRVRLPGKLRRLPLLPALRNQAGASTTGRLRDISRSCFRENPYPTINVTPTTPQRSNGPRR